MNDSRIESSRFFHGKGGPSGAKTRFCLGDSGYTPSPVLLTPVRHVPEGTPEALYTHDFVRGRCRIEQFFGIWTAVNRGVKRERELCYTDPVTVANFIEASAVLHNFRTIYKYVKSY